jgi:hypothetical protein
MFRLAFAPALLASAQLLLAVPALASAGMGCEGLDDKDVSVEMNLPRSPGSPPNWVRIDVPGKAFSTLDMDEAAAPLSIKQAFDGGDSFNIDLTDDNYAEAVVRIRLLRAVEGDDLPVYIGYLHVVGHGIYPISCTEDE